MVKQREFSFELPLGYTAEDGSSHRQINLRKMTGHEELLMTDPDLMQNSGKLITELLSNCIINLGSLGKISNAQVATMTSADRDFLIVKLRAITFGKTLAGIYNCHYCGAVVHLTHNLDQLPMVNVNSNYNGKISVELVDGYEDKGEVYTSMTFRPPNGMDEELTANLARQNISRAKNAVFTRCLTKFGTMAVERFQALGTKIFLDLALADRRLIDQAFAQQLPRLNLSQEITCPQCNSQFSVQLDLGNFLLPA